MIKKILLYINTIKFLRPYQLLSNVFLRIKNIYLIKFITKDLNVVCSINNLTLDTYINYNNKLTNNVIYFLNIQKNIDDLGDWSAKEQSKLWRYNLHYFDFLLDEGASIRVKDMLIDDWINHGALLKSDAWEPYPISLRLVNWIKYFVIYKNNIIPDSWMEILYKQAYVLNSSIEYHILANHYLKNGKGLFFAGAYLNGADSKKWFEKGKKILLEQANEQILNDGGHYEKSPMYHSIFVEDYLDVINLLNSNSLEFSVNENLLLKDITNRALEYLDSIIMPDREIPLFNDSAFKIAPKPDEIFSYANRVMGFNCKSDADKHKIYALKDSGYFVIRNDQSMCIIDCGSISPSYQPGHTHCDLLSYELAINGIRLIVDSGLHDYEASNERRFSRSTKAHNTIEIDNKEQSEVWGQFRVARRAKVLSACLNQQNAKVIFEGSYQPYWANKCKIIHSRKIELDNDSYNIVDTVSGTGSHLIKNYIHLHPHFTCTIDKNACIIYRDGSQFGKILFSSNMTATIESSLYSPEFGVKCPNVVIVLLYEGLLPVTTEYIIESFK